MTSGADVAEIRARLTDPRQLCSALSLLDGYKPGRQAGGGLVIRCPAHGERNPSCSVHRGRDGTIQVHCFSCDFSGDALTLIAVARGLDPRADFQAVLGEGARLAGMALGATYTPRPTRPEPAPLVYPGESEVAALWAEAYPVEADEEARAYLDGRAIDPGAVDLYDLARVVQPWAPAPSWARCRGKTWPQTHRLILPVVDYLGAVRSLRAWRLPGAAVSEDTPKRTAPAGKALAGLVLACPVARRMLATGQAPGWHSPEAPLRVAIVEGEPDFLTWASRVRDVDPTPPAILGVVAGSWTDAIADRIPDGTRVLIRTHQDPSGDRYAAEIKASLAGRAVTIRDFERGGRGESST